MSAALALHQVVLYAEAHAAGLAALTTAATGGVGLVVLLLLKRFEAKKLSAETLAVAAADTKADVEANKVALETQLLEKHDAIEEAERIIGWMDKQQKRLEERLEDQRAYYEAQLKEQDARNAKAMTKMRTSLERKIAELGKRVDVFGCKNAPGCTERCPLDAT
jgi:hypothetical protein